MEVSIIVPVRKINAYIKESLSYIKKLAYPHWEVLIIPDKKEKNDAHLENKKIKIVAGPIEPGRKRDFGVKISKGEILAFIDDDAFPVQDWLDHALKHFKNNSVGAVCGPAVTPLHDSSKQKISGYFYESFLGSGNLRWRYLPLQQRDVDDAPSCNLLVRRSVFEKAGGYNSHYYPGEDTKLCLDIVKKGYRIVYEPKAMVYHHRRAIFKGHLTQIWNYGLHRGFFMKKFPETSLRVGYLLPLVFFMGLMVGPFLFQFGAFFEGVYAASVFLYVLGLIQASSPAKTMYTTLLTMLTIPLTHLVYAVGVLRGVWAKELKR